MVRPKKIKAIWLSVIALFFIFQSFSNLGYSAEIQIQNVAQNEDRNEVLGRRDLQSYQRDLRLLMTIAKEVLGAEQISIGGGTARALIQHVMLGTPFDFRDFDIVLTANQEVTKESARAFGLELEKRGLGTFSEENLRPRPRYNDALPPQLAGTYNAGFGFFVHSPQKVEYDISIFHSDEAMNLNGILDVDMLRVTIDMDSSLTDFFSKKEKFLSSIYDPAHALPKVLEGGIPKVVSWSQFRNDPANLTIRIVRGMSKFNALPFDELSRRRLRELNQSNDKSNALQVSRNLFKLLEDQQWRDEFKELVDLGVFRHHFKSFPLAMKNQSFLNSQDLNERVALLLESASTEDALKFLKLLSDLQPKLISSVLPRLINKKRLKVGYFTGEFAPFHLGHLGVVQSVLKAGALDLVFVIPTPHPTNDPKTVRFSVKEWEERRAFAKAGVTHEVRAWTWPFQLDKPTLESTFSSTPKLGPLIGSLESFVGKDVELTHVFGMDSYHRVVARELDRVWPRPRIVVTRPGVPLPEGAQGSNVRVIENLNATPISATRILHEIAAHGESADLSADVLKLVKSTPRYRAMLKGLREESQNISESISGLKDIGSKTLLWDPRENRAGLYLSEAPEFDASYSRVLDRLNQLGAKKLVVQIPEDSPAWPSWAAEAARRQRSMTIKVTDRNRRIAERNLVHVVHSGIANEVFKGGDFRDQYSGASGLIIYETPDQPVSALLRSVRGIEFLSLRPGSCRELFTAVGF